MGFHFVDHGRLIDGELELVQPEARWIDAVLAACAHPASACDPNATNTTRQGLIDFLAAAPLGRQPGNLDAARVPSYSFWMRLHAVGATPPPIEIAGSITLRVGQSHDLAMYVGHIGYNVYPPARGRRYAERSCRLLLDLARAHGMHELWITCNPDNHASRRTCQRLGCRLVEIVAVPAAHPLYQRGDRDKCRYWLELQAPSGRAPVAAIAQFAQQKTCHKHRSTL